MLNYKKTSLQPLKPKIIFIMILFIFLISLFSINILVEKNKLIKQSESALADIDFILPYTYLINSLANERGKFNGFLNQGSFESELKHAFKQTELDIADLPLESVPKHYTNEVADIKSFLTELVSLRNLALNEPSNVELSQRLFDKYGDAIKKIYRLISTFQLNQEDIEVAIMLNSWLQLETLKEYFARERGFRYGLLFKNEINEIERKKLFSYVYLQERLMNLPVSLENRKIFLNLTSGAEAERFADIRNDVNISPEKWWSSSTRRIHLIQYHINLGIAKVRNQLISNVQDLKSEQIVYVSLLLGLFFLLLVFFWKILRQVVLQINILNHNVKLIGLENTAITLKKPIYNDEIGGLIKKLNKMIVESRASVANLILFEAVFLNIEQMILITDKNNKIIFVNKSFEKTYGYSKQELMGKEPKIISPIKHEENKQGVIWNKNKAGEKFPVELSLTSLKDNNKQLTNYIAIISDISIRFENDKKIWHQANVDALTGLYNRQYLIDSLEHSISIAKRNNNMLAVLFIDLDGFKLVNDLQGHKAGDNLLKHIAKQLLASVRETDTVARLGGDEMIVVLTDVSDLIQVKKIASKILKAITKSFRYKKVDISVTASVGVSIFSTETPDVLVDELIQQADTAMYHAKELGKNRVEFYQDDQHQKIVTMVKTHEELLLAINNNELRLYYQPIIDLKTNKTIGAEALVRWQHPEKGLIFPDQFISIAEKMGSIIPLGEWVLNEAYRQGVEWKKLAAFKNFNLTVNLSPKQCQDSFKEILKLLKKITQDCEQQNIVNFLQIEVTESVLVDDYNLIDNFYKIKDLGFKLLIDDFGTGYSSLSYLKKFPVDKLKIDRAFIKDIESDEESLPLVKAIISLSHALKIEVVAEGHELSA